MLACGEVEAEPALLVAALPSALVAVTGVQHVGAVTVGHIQLILPLVLPARSCREAAMPMTLAIPAEILAAL